MMLTTELMVAEVFEDRAWIITRLRLAAHRDICGFIFITQGYGSLQQANPFIHRPTPGGRRGHFQPSQNQSLTFFYPENQ